MARTSISADGQWARIQLLLPSSTGRRGCPFGNDGRVVQATFTGSGAGRLAGPEEFGQWQTIWERHRRYSGDGTWDKILAGLLTPVVKLVGFG